jgi:hypothetical protein
MLLKIMATLAIIAVISLTAQAIVPILLVGLTCFVLSQKKEKV